MIFYFSGTGNSRWAAQQLAHATGDRIHCITQKPLPDLQNERQIGLVFPIYAWGAPEAVRQFAGQLPASNAFRFAVATCGADAGYALKKLASVYHQQSSYSLVMPSNYILGEDVEEKASVQHKLQAARQQIQQMAMEVSKQMPVYQVEEGFCPWLKSTVVNWGFQKFGRSTAPFYATDCCIGCGMCAANCPAKTISLQEGKPCWGKECWQCLRCINYCPRQAIQYGEKTKKRGRYTLEQYQQ